MTNKNMPPDLESLKHFQLISYHSTMKHQDLLLVSEEESSKTLPWNREPRLHSGYSTGHLLSACFWIQFGTKYLIHC